MKGKRAAFASMISPLVRTGVLRSLASRRGLLVLNYHRIGNPMASPLDRGLFSATQDILADQVEFLTRNCRIVSIADVLAGAHLRERNCVLLTFDDGYRDNYTLAFPVLRAAGIPATFFIATDFIDRPRLPWWDEIAYLVRRLMAPVRIGLPSGDLLVAHDNPETQIRAVLNRYKRESAHGAEQLLSQLRAEVGPDQGAPESQDLWMTWDMIRELHRCGLDIGGHTASHPILSTLDGDAQRAEIQTCTSRLTEEIGERPAAFAYPVGGRAHFNDITSAELQAAGYKIAFSFYGGWNRSAGPWAPFDVRRTSVELDQSMAEFELGCVWPAWVR